MKINIVKEQQSILSYKNQIGISNGEFKKNISNIISNSSKTDEYISVKTVDKALGSDTYKMNLNSKLNSKMPITKYSNNGVLTLTEKKLLFIPYEENEKGWSKSIFNQKEYDTIIDKIEKNNSLEMESEDFWKEDIENKHASEIGQEDGADSNIVVNADGSRSLVITMKMGGVEATMCIEISKPTKFQNSKEDTPNEESLEETDLKVEQNLGEMIDNIKN